MVRGYGIVSKMVARFLSENGYDVHLGAWVDIKLRGRLVFDFQVGHWLFHRPPRRGVPSALYLFTEGRIDPKARDWLRGYDYIFCPSRWVRDRLQEIGLDCILMPVGIDTNLFRPLNTTKYIDVLSIGIWESSWDNRKFMDRVCQVAFPHTCYAHTKPTLPYDQLPLLYNSAKLYVSLSGCEGFNIPVVEANACGLIVVYNDACATSENAYGIPVKPRRVYEVRDRGVPFLIHEPDIEAIRREVHRLLKNSVRLEAFSKEARINALRYDYRRTYIPLLEVLPKP